MWRTNDGVTLTFIGPSLPFIESDNTINDDSIAFMLQYKHFRMLFTGDAGIMFGHPAPSTIDRLHRFGARVYRLASETSNSRMADRLLRCAFNLNP